MSKTLWSNVNHQIHVAYQRGYGKSASERREMREKEDIRTIAVKTSREVITRDCKRFCEFVKERHPQARTVSVSREYIEEWKNYLLQEKGLRSETVHGYIDHLGVVYGVSGGQFGLGRSPELVKGRSERSERDIRDRDNEKYENFTRLAEMTGLRRSEIGQIRYDSFYRKDDGYYYLQVTGKGGKEQEQRILHEHDKYVERYIGERSHDKICSAEQTRNHINVHAERRELAQKAYEEYKTRCDTKEGRISLFDELKKEFDERYDLNGSGRTWRDNGDMKILAKDLESVYKCRGSQREEFERQGKTAEFDRLPLMAVSVFHLAHWRCDVTVQNYMK